MRAIGRLGWRTHCRGLRNGHSILRNGWKLFLPKCQSGWASSLLAVPALFLDVSSLLEIQHAFQVVMNHMARQVTGPQSQNHSQTEEGWRRVPCQISLVTLPIWRQCPAKWTHSSVVTCASLWQTPWQLDSTQHTSQECMWNLWRILLTISTSVSGMFALNRVRIQYMKPTHTFT